MTRRLELVFEDCAGFRAEYEQNIVQGGAFVASTEPFEMREAVEVELVLSFAGERVVLEAEVVHALPVDVAGDDGAGVAVQFNQPAAQLRDLLEGFLGRGADDGAARGGSDDGAAAGGSDDFGAIENDLVDFDAGGDEAAAAPRDPDPAERTTVARFAATAAPDSAPEIEGRLEAATGAVSAATGRELALGIAGRIEELGTPSLVQMFGTAGARGTLTFVHGEQVGTIGVDAGKLRGVELGRYRGTKALARILAWESGLFHFHAELDEALAAQEPVAIEAAILAAIHQLDEVARKDLPGLDLEATLVPDAESLNGRALTTTEEAVVELAEAGFSIARLIDVIPEPDAEVLEAVRGLIEAGVVELRSA